MNYWGVWTFNPDPEWIAHNAGIDEMLLSVVGSRDAAIRLSDRLYEMYGDPNLFVREV